MGKISHTIAHRVGRYLERRGLLEHDADNTYLTQEAVAHSDKDPSSDLLGSSITYRIALGPQQGRQVITYRPSPIVDNILDTQDLVAHHVRSWPI